jgi:SAM-dependent methyltransferase
MRHLWYRLQRSGLHVGGLVGMRLNLGCGFDRRAGYVNVDLQAFHGPDIVGDITELNELPSNAYDEVLAQDVLEHFKWRDTPKALNEWNRLLRPGGKIFIRTTYLNGLLRRFEDPALASIEMQKLLVINLFSMQGYEGDFHLTGFSERLLRFYLWAAGFVIDIIEVRDHWLFEVWATKVEDRSYEQLFTSSPEEFVTDCYNLILRRPPDLQGLQFYATGIEDQSISRRDLVRRMLLSDENQERLAREAPLFDLLFDR